MARVRLHVRGHVQGVFFRESARAAADSMGVRGWIRNLADGRVEAVAEGDEAALRRFVAWCRGGPPMSRVEGVDEVWGGHEEGLGRFEVRR